MFFDNNPGFERQREEVIRRAHEMCENGIIDEKFLPSVFGDLELAFHYDMESNINQIRTFTAFLGSRQPPN